MSEEKKEEKQVTEKPAENKENDADEDKRSAQGAIIFILSVIIVLVVGKYALSSLRSHHTGATSVLNQSTEEGYYESFFK